MLSHYMIVYHDFYNKSYALGFGLRMSWCSLTGREGSVEPFEWVLCVRLTGRGTHL